MKKLLFIVVLFLLAICNYSFAGGSNDTLNTSFKVNGNVACKTSIEASISGKLGVISVSWDATTKMITVKHISATIPAADIHAYLAMAGYDTSELRAKPAKYDALSSECKYTRDPETE